MMKNYFEARMRGIDLCKLETERFDHFNHTVSMMRHYERANRFYNRMKGVNAVLAFVKDFDKTRAKVQQSLEREEISGMTPQEIEAAMAAITKASNYLDKYQTITIVCQNYLANKMSAEVALENIIRVIGE